MRQTNERSGDAIERAVPISRRAEGLREFAASLGVSYDSVFRRAQDGRLKTVRFGKRRLVPAEEIARVMREGL
jgi:excisionase family DNA binding protein